MRIDIAYGTRTVRLGSGRTDPRIVLVVDNPRAGHRMGTVVPVEDGRAIVTLAGFHGDVPPTDADGFHAFARSLPSPAIADLLAGTEPLGPVLTHRMPTSQRRRMELLKRHRRGS